MKCPICEDVDLAPATKPGYFCCPRCRAIYLEKVKDDPNLALYKYDIEIMRCRNPEPSAVFEKAKGKFDHGKREVIGIRLDRGNYSLLFGQNYFVITRKKRWGL